MTNSFEDRSKMSALVAKDALDAFLSTKGSLTEIQEVPRALVKVCSEALVELTVYLDSFGTPGLATDAAEAPQPRQEPSSRSIEGKILRDIRAGKDVTGEGDPDRRKALNFLSKHGYIQNTGSRRYPKWEAIDE